MILFQGSTPVLTTGQPFSCEIQDIKTEVMAVLETVAPKTGDLGHKESYSKFLRFPSC